jgi:hypothetical protein
MSLEHAYCSLEQLKARIGLQSTDERDDEALEGIIEAVSRMIDAECFGGDSHFYASTETRYYTATRFDRIDVDDLLTVTTLKTDHDGDGSFEVSWATSDFVLAPYNAPTLSLPRPYWTIEVAALGKTRFPVGIRRAVQVVGTWGYGNAVPKEVETVCLRESLFHFAATRTPYGATTGDGSTAVAPAISLSNHSRLMLVPFRRVSVA